MTRNELERNTVELAEEYIAGRMSRRAFIQRLLALGLTTTAAGAILAARDVRGHVGCNGRPDCGPHGRANCRSHGRSHAGPYRRAINELRACDPEYLHLGRRPLLPRSLDGARGRIAADHDRGVPEALSEHQRHLPVLRLGLVRGPDPDIRRAGAHDVYWLDEWHYVLWSPRDDLFADISAYVNDPAWASEKSH